MSQYQVPQFIETEDKIIGPLTIKQFLILAAAGAISFLTFFVFQTWLWVMTTIFFGAIAAFFSFIKINGQPSYVVLFSAFAYLWKPRLFVWQKKEEMTATAADVTIAKSLEEKKRFPLRSLWNKILTTTQNITNREKSSPTSQEVRAKYNEPVKERSEVKRIDYR